MARERSIVVRLRAEISDYQNKMGQASRSLSDFEKSQQKLGGAADTTMGRLVQSARINEQEWQSVGKVLATTGGAVTALGLAAIKTGVQYNTLQQTTRAALTTIMGGAEDANAQMDKLDNFARNSPFAKQVFIEAQQQMLGFGIEARKVLPYLDSIQNAVAATGGSNQDIAELSRIFSTVHANAKITARDLMMFGQRGVDAATIIGEQMGKTGAQIRDEITAGTLDAGEALDALSAGMQENFGGSADAVKDTFAGALDRVKAAWRDFGAELATPLVDPSGGGALIDFFNGIADAMRQFIGAPGWIKGTVTAIAGLTGAAALAGGTLLMAAPRFFRFREELQTLANAHPMVGRLTGAVGALGKAAGIGAVLAGVAVGLGAIANAIKNDVQAKGLRSLTTEIESLAAAGKDASQMELTDFLQEIPNFMGIATIEAETFGDVLDTLLDPSKTDEMADFLGNWLPSYMHDNREIAEELDAALTHMLTLGGDKEAAAVQFMENLGYETSELEKVLPGASDALAGVKEEADETAKVADALAGSFLGIGASAEDAQDIMDNWASTVADASASFGGILDAYDAVIEKQGETSASTSQTMEDWIAELQAQAKAHEEWAGNVTKAMEQANTEMSGEAQLMHKAFVDEMTAAGVEGAAALQTFVDATPEQRAELVEAWAGTKDDIQAVLDAAEDPNIGIDVDPEQAEAKVNEILAWIGEKTADPLKVDADTSGAESDVNLILRHWAGTTTDTNVGANIQPADTTTRDLFGKWSRTTTDTNVDANKNPAENTVQGMLNKWAGTTTDTNVDANTNPASSAFSGVTGHWARTTTTTKIGADTSPARSAWESFKSTVGSITTSIIAKVTGGSYQGGFINPGKYEGGPVLPGRKAGGWVPGQRAGYDNILWPLHSGGQVLSQPLEGREFVVRSSQAHRYTPELYAMNNGSFPTGMMERLYSSNSAGPMSVQVAAPPVDTAAIGAAVASAIRSYQPVVQIGGREFYGAMREANAQFGRL